MLYWSTFVIWYVCITHIEVWLPSFAFCLSRFYVWVGGEGEGASQIVWFLQNPKDLQSQVFHTNQGTRA